LPVAPVLPHPPTSRRRSEGRQMSEKRHADRRLDRRTTELIGQQLKDYYRSCFSEELPPSLLAVLKKLDEETELSDSKLK
jgi:hypothetical protein